MNYKLLLCVLCSSFFSSLAATGGVIELTKRENEQGELAKAKGAAEFEKVMDGAGDQLQQDMGVKDSAKVKLYQGDSKEIKEADEQSKPIQVQRTNHLTPKTERPLTRKTILLTTTPLAKTLMT